MAPRAGSSTNTREPSRARSWRAEITAPGPRGGDMIRGFGLIRRDPLKFLQRAWHTHGDVVQFPIPRPATYLITDPHAVRDILVGRSGTFDKQTLQYRTLAMVTGTGLLTADDPPWRDRRRVLQPVFHRDAIGSVTGHVATAVDHYLATWEGLPDGSVVDIAAAMTEISLRASAATLFGIDVGVGADRLGQASAAALDAVVARARNPIGALLPRSRRMARSVDALDRFVDEIIAERKRDPRQPRPSPDVLDVLLQAQSDPNTGIDAAALRAELVTALVAGHETVATALTWVWQLLGQFPSAAACLHAEVDDSGGQPGPFTGAVVSETLRLCPPAWVITRRSEGQLQVGGFAIPAKALLIMSPWLIHRHPAIWPRPETFEPQRFLVDSEPRVGYLPFGVGPRQCIGRDMALLECAVAVSKLAARCDFEPLDDRPVRVNASVTARPADGLRMSLRWR